MLQPPNEATPADRPSYITAAATAAFASAARPPKSHFHVQLDTHDRLVTAAASALAPGRPSKPVTRAGSTQTFTAVSLPPRQAPGTQNSHFHVQLDIRWTFYLRSGHQT